MKVKQFVSILDEIQDEVMYLKSIDRNYEPTAIDFVSMYKEKCQ